MERLRELEELQKSMMLMQSHSVVSASSHGDKDSDLFLASFLDFLMQPCGELDLENKCALVSEYISKISAGFLEKPPSLCSNHKASSLSEGFQQQQQRIFEKGLQRSSEDKSYFDVGQTNSEDMAIIGLDAMQRANSTLEDFCRSYFMFHGMDVNKPQAIFKYLPVLSFTESYIYQLDSLNEKALHVPTNGVKCSEKWNEEVNLSSVARFTNVFKSDPFIPLAGLLDCHVLLTERIKEEFKHGEEYWNLERTLCRALANRKDISVEDVMKAIHLKSFDFRVLNLLLYQLRGEQVDELHMEFLSVSEFLVEVADDLFDYEDDVAENSFNVLRMFVRLYGTSAPTMLAKYITEAEEKYNFLLNVLDPQLSSDYQKRCKEATQEGGNTSKHPLGMWNIPRLILDEEVYRSNLERSEMSHRKRFR